MNKINQNGFTIIEVLIASFVFSIITIVVATNFVDVLKLQRRGLAAQTMQEEALFAFESMAREIRVSQIQTPNNPCTATSLTIDHPIKDIIVYTASNGIINKTVGGETFPITSPKTNFSNFKFCVLGVDSNDRQAKVTIITSVQSTGGEGLQFDLQTTITSRDVRKGFLN